MSPAGSTILVTTDNSELGHRALAHAQTLARALHAEVTVLYVQPDPLPPLAEAYVYLPGETDSAQEQALREIWDDLVRRLPEARVRVKRAEGHPVPRVIVDTAREEGADLILMSTHGRSGLGRALLGSVAEAVAHHAPVPVLLVRADHAVKDWTAGGRP